jgi:hypothetical protein
MDNSPALFYEDKLAGMIIKNNCAKIIVGMRNNR